MQSNAHGSAKKVEPGTHSSRRSVPKANGEWRVFGTTQLGVHDTFVRERARGQRSDLEMCLQ